VGFEWDPEKARINFRKHDGIRFEEAREVFDDPYAITISDNLSDENEQRFVAIGMGARGRVLVVVYAWRGAAVRIISARLAAAHERADYEEGLL